MSEQDGAGAQEQEQEQEQAGRSKRMGTAGEPADSASPGRQAAADPKGGMPGQARPGRRQKEGSDFFLRSAPRYTSCLRAPYPCSVNHCQEISSSFWGQLTWHNLGRNARLCSFACIIGHYTFFCSSLIDFFCSFYIFIISLTTPILYHPNIKLELKFGLLNNTVMKMNSMHTIFTTLVKNKCTHMSLKCM